MTPSAKSIDRICVRCLEAFAITPADQAYFARKATEAGAPTWTLPVRCRSCRDIRRREGTVVQPAGIDLQVICRDCATAFVFTENEQDFYARKGFRPPRRCHPCRRAVRPAFNDDQSGDM